MPGPVTDFSFLREERHDESIGRENIGSLLDRSIVPSGPRSLDHFFRLCRSSGGDFAVVHQQQQWATLAHGRPAMASP